MQGAQQDYPGRRSGEESEYCPARSYKNEPSVPRPNHIPELPQEPSPRSTPSTRGSLKTRHPRKHLKTRRRTWNHDARQDLKEIPAHQTAEKQLTNLAQDKFQAIALSHNPIEASTLSELQNRDSKTLRLKYSSSTVTGCQAQPGKPGFKPSSP